MIKEGRLVGATLLVAGTAIGGGMLALPVITSAGGFLPSIVIYFLCWLFMVATGLLLMEITLDSPPGANIVSMAKKTLGLFGQIVAWALYIFLFYSLSVAYISGGGYLINDLLHMSHTSFWGPLVFALIFAPFVIVGPLLTGRINAVLMIGLLLSFLVFFILGFRHVDITYLTRSHFKLALAAMPTAFTAFAYQGIVPTLTQYLGRNKRKTTIAIVVGTTLPFVMYVIWQWLILGVVPFNKLEETLCLNETAVYSLKNILHLPWLFWVGQCFAFFAIVTSFFGVTLGLLDFLIDGFKLKKHPRARVLLGALVFLPPLIFAWTNPCLFLKALHFAGGIGCALLLGLLPIVMVWRNRYHLGIKDFITVPGGRGVLLLLLLFVLFELVVMVKFA